MKKFILCTAVALFASATYASAMPQFIITDCGTVYQIPDDTTSEEACEMIDIISEIDCGTSQGD